MKTSKYEELLADQVRLERLLLKLGIKPSSNNRWVDAYNLVKRLNESRLVGNADKLSPQEMGRMRFALLDLSEMRDILDTTADVEPKILRPKFEILLTGAADRTTEVSSNTRSRDIQLELVIYSVLKRAGLKASLSDPNPDIMVDSGAIQYGMECKRIFTSNSNAVVTAAANAAAQLRRTHISDNRHGIIALGIDRFITGGDKVLESESELAARVFLAEQIENFIETHGRRWTGTKIIKDERIAGILIYMSVMGTAIDENIPFHGTQIGFTNINWTRWGARNFKLATSDIVDPLLNAAGKENELVRNFAAAAKAQNKL
jgi:hypothetical protein